MTTMQKITCELTDEERAAIEAYSGPVKRVPRGTSGLPVPQWDEKKNALRYEKPPRYGRNYKHVPGHIRKQQRKQAERRQRVKAMSLEGRKPLFMAVRCDVSTMTIYQDLRELRKAGEIE